MRIRNLCLVLLCISVLGCGSEGRHYSPSRGVPEAAISYSPANGSNADASGNEQTTADVTSLTQSETDAETRRIIYDANVRLIVKDFTEVESRLAALVAKCDGYMADVTVSQNSGSNRSGTWKARIPSTSFNEFLSELGRLGVPENLRQTAEDVTAEYVDIQARITNKKRLEQRIIELLENSKGRISEIIEVERELARVRGEIEQMEGRLRYLSNKTRFSTVTVNVIEKVDYVPPQTPTFGEQLAQVWRDSLGELLAFGKVLLFFIVGFIPWALVGICLLSPFVYLVFRQLRIGRRAMDATIVE